MARTTLAIGQEIDIPTREEMDAASDRVIAALLPAHIEPLIERPAVIVNVDAGGLLGGGAGGPGAEIYRVPTGYCVDIERLGLSSPGVTPAAPLAAGWVIAVTDSTSSPPDFTFPGAGTTTVLPDIRVDGGPGSARLNGGQRLLLVGAGLTANLEIQVRLQVRLYAYPTGGRDTDRRRENPGRPQR